MAGTVDEVSTVLGDAVRWAQWWPSVYLDVRELKPAGADGTARVLDLFTTGWLPYSWRWTMTITEPVSPTGFALAAEGDLVGTGRWTFAQEGPEVAITYDWRIRAAKPLLRRLTWLMRPVFSANHRWAMARESLRLELRRRRGTAASSDIRPPGPRSPGLRNGGRRDRCPDARGALRGSGRLGSAVNALACIMRVRAHGQRQEERFVVEEGTLRVGSSRSRRTGGSTARNPRPADLARLMERYSEDFFYAPVLPRAIQRTLARLLSRRSRDETALSASSRSEYCSTALGESRGER